MFDLADETLNLPFDELIKYDEKFSDGGYFGYKVAGDQIVDEKGTVDCSQLYNISKDVILRVSNHTPFEHPSTIIAHKTELEQLIKSRHEVAMAVSRALFKELGLDPDIIPLFHQIDKTSGDTARVTHAPPVPADTIALGEHCDFASVTVLFNQLGGLQVLEPNTRDWKYVKPQPPDAIINLGDTMVKFTGVRLYAGVHRVVGPPGGQARVPRHSVGYFCRPNSDVKLQSLFKGEAEDNAMTADEWTHTGRETGPQKITRVLRL